jgi:gamma-butyrobetaine dioxygenase
VQLKERDLSIQWSNCSSVDLPYIYLRDNCQEPESFDTSARQRLFNPAFSVDLHIQAKTADVNDDGRLLTVTWPDGHRSRFESSWLSRYARGKQNMSGRLGVEKVYWESDYYSKMPRFDYEMLMEDDCSLLEYLISLESHGLVLVDNVGLESTQAKKLCERIFYPKPCHYGREMMAIESVPDPSNIAFSSLGLDLHSDFTQYDHMVGVVMLHFIYQVSSPTDGKSVFCDGVNVARALKEINPSAFDILSQYPIQFVDSGTDVLGDFHAESWQCPISLDQNGEVVSIAFNNHIRGPHFSHILMDKLPEWYAAYYEFSKLLHSPKYRLEFKLSPGQMFVTDNRRVLHGRTAYKMDKDEYRYGVQCYMDWDELRSKARVLMKNLNVDIGQ